MANKVLGTVIKKHDSGNVETNKGYIIQGKFEIGEVLEMDEKRKVFKKEKQTNQKKGGKNDDKNLDKDKDEGENLDKDKDEGEDNV